MFTQHIRNYVQNPGIIINAINCTTFNFILSYSERVKVEWGDGTIQDTGSDFNKTYSTPFTGVIKITGKLNRVISFITYSSTGISLDLKEFWKFKNLQLLTIGGGCLINNTIAEIPRVTNSLTLANLPNLTMSGSILDLPRVTNSLYLLNIPNLEIEGTSLDLPRVTQSLQLLSLPNLILTGSIIDLPRVTSVFILQSLPNLSLTGSTLDLPRVTSTLQFRSLSNLTLTGSIIDLPRVNGQLTLISVPNLIISGTTIDLPRVTGSLEAVNLTNLTLTGTVIDLPRVTSRLDFSGLPNVTISGAVNDLPRVTVSLALSYTPNITLTGDFANLPLANYVVISPIISSSVTYTPFSAKKAISNQVVIEMSTKFKTTQTDNILIDYATFTTTWNIPKVIRLSSLGRTSASDSAVATLVSRGVSIALI